MITKYGTYQLWRNKETGELKRVLLDDKDENIDSEIWIRDFDEEEKIAQEIENESRTSSC